MWQQHQPDATQPEVMGKNWGTQPTVLGNFGYHSIKKSSLGLHLLIYFFCTAKNQNRDEMDTIFHPSKQHGSPVVCYTHLLLEAGTATAPTRLLSSLTSPEQMTSQDADGTQIYCTDSPIQLSTFNLHCSHYHYSPGRTLLTGASLSFSISITINSPP